MAKATIADIRRAILNELPEDGSAMGNQRLRERIAECLDANFREEDYTAARDALIEEGKLAKGMGRGGSVRRVLDDTPGFNLQAQELPASAKTPKPKQAGLPLSPSQPGAGRAARKGDDGARILAYQHEQKRRNNPDVGVVTPETDPEQPRTTWAYDPHIDPALQFDMGRAEIESLIDEALGSGDETTMRSALESLKRMAAPYLNWTGKAERTSFEVDTVSLHVHERIDPATVLRAIQKRMKDGSPNSGRQGDMFRAWFEDPLPLREAIEFYKHDRGWSNRLVAGDSLLVMNSLLQKESMAGQVQMIYIDPPYGIKYGSNFQPFVNKRKVEDRKDKDLTQEPEMIKAFRDTWELGIHSYLTYLRDRLLLAKDLLNDTGSIFVQISDENIHHVKELLDEVFGAENLISVVTTKKTGGMGEAFIDNVSDYLIWFAKNKKAAKFNPLFLPKEAGVGGGARYNQVQLENGLIRGLSRTEKADPETTPQGSRIFLGGPMTSETASDSTTFSFELYGRTLDLEKGGWKTNLRGMNRLIQAGRLRLTKDFVNYKIFIDDFPAFVLTNLWSDTMGTAEQEKSYVVQTVTKVIERCMLMTTDPGDLVLDPTCGSGTTAFVAEKWGRRWITCDTSRVAITLAKQRLMTASYDYFELKYPHEGLKGGFIYKTVPHVTLKSIANNAEIDEIWDRLHPAIDKALDQLNAALKSAGGTFEVTEGGRKGEELNFKKGGALQEWEVPFDFPPDWSDKARAAFDAFHAARQAMQRQMDASIAAHADQETLYDQPAIAKNKLRVTGPFTVEAVPFPTVVALDEAAPPAEADMSVARSGESSRQHCWRDELFRTGIRGKGGQMLKFADLETLPDTRHLHCSGHLDSGERVVVSFGPEHAALEQRQVALALNEAEKLRPSPKLIVFCAFMFDPEAAKDIDETRWPGITLLKAQMNTDLLTEDLKRARSSNQSFWLMGQPDVELRQRKDGKWEVEVNGFDYFDTTTGELKSGGKKNIAAWSLDTDYDERSLFPSQVFFPMAGAKDGWHKLKRDIKAELNEALLDKLHGTVSLPFEPGDNRKVAVKIVDDRGIESLKVIALP